MKTQQTFFIRTGPVTCLLLLLSSVAALAQKRQVRLFGTQSTVAM